MAVKITPEEFSLLIQRLNTRWRVLAPSAEFRGGRFADTDNIIYQQIRGWDDLVWQWICPYISRHLLSLNPLQACCRRYSRGER